MTTLDEAARRVTALTQELNMANHEYERLLDQAVVPHTRGGLPIDWSQGSALRRYAMELYSLSGGMRLTTINGWRRRIAERDGWEPLYWSHYRICKLPYNHREDCDSFAKWPKTDAFLPAPGQYIQEMFR